MVLLAVWSAVMHHMKRLYLLVHDVMAVTEVRRPSGLLQLSQIAVPLTFHPFVVASKTSLDLPFSLLFGSVTC